MENRKEIIDSIWREVEKLETKPPDMKKTEATPNKIFAVGACCLLFITILIALTGEKTFWLALCFLPFSYLIDKYSSLEAVRNREMENFNL